MTCFVYVIGSATDCARGGPYRTYVGWTNDLVRRVEAHNSGKGARSTRGRAWELLYAEAYAQRGDAMSREWHIKRDRKFRKMLSGNQTSPQAALGGAVHDKGFEGL